MQSRHLRRSLAGGAALAVLIFASAAAAQNAPAAGSAEEASDVDTVVVTGSRIAGAAKTGAIAVSIVNEDQIDIAGSDTTGEILSNIPQAGGMEFNESSDGPNSARGDVATVNLRGLGAGNTLVLLNGRRMAPFARSQDVDESPRQVVNVNEIPAGAVQRIEILRDGASALYGADATAGVVNTILRKDYEGLRVTSRYGGSEGTALRQTSVDLTAGKSFNGGDTNLTLIASWFSRDGMMASEREYASSVDTRRLLPPAWAADTQFRNLSSSTPWGSFQAGTLGSNGVFNGTRVRIGSANVTNTTGVFHIQPVTEAGTTAVAPWNPALGLDDGTQNSSLFYDTNTLRQITPDTDRQNLYLQANHRLSNGVEFFGELSLYHSSTEMARAAQPMDESLSYIIVPRQNYWNPFGPTGSPNRIPGINAPSGGLDVLIQDYRPIDIGVRDITTDSSSYRGVAGVRGDFRGWDWESGFVYHRVATRDEEANDISKTALQARLALATPDAFNPFNGVEANSQAVLDSVRISSVNKGVTSLTSWDLRASRPDLFRAPGGPVGVAFGVEWRREAFEDDRDPRLDGTVVFGDGVGSNGSDIVGVSPTADSSADRDVWAAYAELLAPLVSRDMNIPLVRQLDLQLAVRGESFMDRDETVLKPKIAMSWAPTDWLLFRGAWSQGFRAPNLVQLYRGDISRLNQGQTDFWRADVTALPQDTGVTYMRSIRESNPDLKSEETETKVLGAVFTLPLFDSFRFNVDYWSFHQDNVIDNFGVEEQLALDYLLRREGSSNPNVVRRPLTLADQAAFDAWNAAHPTDQRAAVGQVDFVRDGYLNLDPRDVQGVDFGLHIDFEKSRFGRISFDAEASKLLRYDQEKKSLEPLLNDPVLGPNFTAESVDRITLDGNPQWRAAGNLTWRGGVYGAGIGFKYIGEFKDTSAANDVTGAFWKVDEWLTWNTYFDYRLKHVGPADSVRLRVGVNNIEDKDPPLADEGTGYFTEYHDSRGRFIYLQLRADF